MSFLKQGQILCWTNFNRYDYIDNIVGNRLYFNDGTVLTIVATEKWAKLVTDIFI